MRSKSLLAILTLFLVVGFLMMLPLGPTFAEDWERQVYGGLSDPNNTVAMPGAVYNNSLYVGTFNQNEGCQVWRYDGSAWTKVIGNGFGDPNNGLARSMEVFDGNLYVATLNGAGGEVWRYNGTTWTQVNENGFGDTANYSAPSMAVYNSALYVGTEHLNYNNCEVWSYDGSAWNQANSDGFGVALNTDARSMAVYGTNLYVGTYNNIPGCQVQVRLERSGATTINATSVAVPSSTQITCTFSLTGAQAGAYNVIVRNPNGQEASLGNGFTVVNAANPCGGGAAISVALAGLMFGLLSLAGSGSLRRRLGKTRK